MLRVWRGAGHCAVRGIRAAAQHGEIAIIDHVGLAVRDRTSSTGDESSEIGSTMKTRPVKANPGLNALDNGVERKKKKRGEGI